MRPLEVKIDSPIWLSFLGASYKGCYKKYDVGAGEMAQQLRAHIILAEDPGWCPSTRIKLLTMGLSLQAQGTDISWHTYMHKYIHLILKDLQANRLAFMVLWMLLKT